MDENPYKAPRGVDREHARKRSSNRSATPFSAWVGLALFGGFLCGIEAFNITAGIVLRAERRRGLTYSGDSNHADWGLAAGVLVMLIVDAISIALLWRFIRPSKRGTQ